MGEYGLKRKQEARALGMRAEEYFSRLLHESGFSILERNYSVYGTGEVDLIANSGYKILSIEIKARTIAGLSQIYDHSATLAVNAMKRKRIYACMQEYCNKHHLGKEYDVSYWLGIYYVNPYGFLLFSDLLACE